MSSCEGLAAARPAWGREGAGDAAAELAALNRIVNTYLEFAELQGLEQKSIYMADWIRKLDDFLRLADRDVLDHAAGTRALDLAPRVRRWSPSERQGEVIPLPLTWNVGRQQGGGTDRRNLGWKERRRTVRNQHHRTLVALIFAASMGWLGGWPAWANGACELSSSGGGSSGWLRVTFVVNDSSPGLCTMDPDTEQCTQATGCFMNVTMIADCIFSFACGGAPSIIVANGNDAPLVIPPDEDGDAKLRTASFQIDCGETITFAASSPGGSSWVRHFSCGDCPTVLPPLKGSASPSPTPRR